MTNAFMGKALTIEGRRLVLGYTFADLVDLEADHPDIMAGKIDQKKLSTATYVRDLIARGLKGQVGTLDEVTALIDAMGGLTEALTWFGQAIAIAYGVGDGGDPVPPRQAQPHA